MVFYLPSNKNSQVEILQLPLEETSAPFPIPHILIPCHPLDKPSYTQKKIKLKTSFLLFLGGEGVIKMAKLGEGACPKQN